MILRENTKLIFSKPIFKVIQISSARDHTFVLLILTDCQGQESIIQIDRAGNIIKQYFITANFGQFAMVEQSVVIIPLQDNLILKIDLQTSEKTCFPFDFLQIGYSSLEMYNFFITKCLCIRQSLHSRDSSSELLKLTFIENMGRAKIPNDLGLHFYIKNQVNLDIISKANNDSLVIYCKRKHFDYFNISLIWLERQLNKDQQVKIKEEHIKISLHTLSEVISQRKMIRIDFIWQVLHHQLILVGAITDNAQSSFQYFVNLDQHTIRKSLIKFPQQEQEIAVSTHFLQQFTVLRAINMKSSKCLTQVKVYIINNQTEQLQQLYISNENYLNHIYQIFPGNKLLQATFKNQFVQDMEITELQILQFKDLYMHMLLHVNGDFDDDLLMDALEEMDCL